MSMEENKGGQSAYKFWKDNAICMQMGSYDREIWKSHRSGAI